MSVRFTNVQPRHATPRHAPGAARRVVATNHTRATPSAKRYADDRWKVVVVEGSVTGVTHAGVPSATRRSKHANQHGAYGKPANGGGGGGWGQVGGGGGGGKKPYMLCVMLHERCFRGIPPQETRKSSRQMRLSKMNDTPEQRGSPNADDTYIQNAQKKKERAPEMTSN